MFCQPVFVLGLALLAAPAVTGQDPLARAPDTPLVAGRAPAPVEPAHARGRVVASAATAAADGTATVHHFKLADPRTGRIRGVALDDRGREVDGEAVAAERVAAARAAVGPLGPVLGSVIDDLPDGLALPVTIWLATPDPVLALTVPLDPGEVTAEASERHAKDLRLARRAVAAPVTGAVGNRLRDLGCPFLIDAELPCIHGMLDAGQLRAAAAWPEVDSIDVAMNPRSEMVDAKVSTRVSELHARGIRGTWVPIAMIEEDGSDVERVSDPYGRDRFFGQSSIASSPTNSDDTADAHATQIAAILVSNLGVAPDASLWIGGCSPGTSPLVKQTVLEMELLNASLRGARAINASYGFPTARFPTSHDRYYDSIVYSRRCTIVKSAGNIAATTDYYNPYGDVTSPGLGYNVITVGAYDNRDTGDRRDDVMYDKSAWRGPLSLHGGRNKPDLVAPGIVYVPTKKFTDRDGTHYAAVVKGTSYAAPFVTGTVALMMQMDATRQLQWWPEAVRASLLASTFHNIEGDSRYSDRDGAGGLDAVNAVRCAQGDQRAGFGCSFYGSWVPSFWEARRPWLTAGIRARVAICWAVDPADSSWMYQPGADLDLVVQDPNGVSLAVSASFDDNFEIVEFTPRTSGYHRIVVSRYRMHRAPNYLGVAWCQEW